MKKIIIIIAIILFTGGLLAWYFIDIKKPPIQERLLPTPRNILPIQGLIWRADSIFKPDIYQDIYNQAGNRRLLAKAKWAGANYLLVRVLYNLLPNGNLEGDDKQAEIQLQKAVNLAHAAGFKVLLVPHIEFTGESGAVNQQLATSTWTEKIIGWSRFAEFNQIEMLAPGFSMSNFFDKDTTSSWYKEILPEIKSIFYGRVAFIEGTDNEQWDYYNDETFLGYDCAGTTIFSQKNYDKVSDMRNWKDFRELVLLSTITLNEQSEKYNINCRIIATLGMNIWNGLSPEAKTLATGYEQAMQIFIDNSVTGVFFNSWASEPDQLGDAMNVEEMLQERWTY